MSSKHSSDLIVQDLEALADKANADIAEKTEAKAHKDAKQAAVKKQLKSTEDEKQANEKSLSDTKIECNQKQLSVTEKRQLRAEEIEAIAKAISILSSDDVLGNAQKHLSLAQVRRATALLQGAGVAASGRGGGIRLRLREFLAGEGQRLHSKRLGLLAEKLAADPFADVKKLIREMIDRLNQEAFSDANNEGFCDKEVGMSEVSRTRLTEEIDSLNAQIEAGKANIAELAQETARLHAEIADADAAASQSTEMRKQEKAQNEATVEDAKAAQKAVAEATSILKEFYAKAATATALLQAPPERERRLMGGAKMGTDEWKELANPHFAAEDSGHKE